MGITNFDIVEANAFIGMGLTTQGNVWHVKPYSGADGQSGKTQSEAVKTVAKALSLATTNQNDTILLYAESNTAANTTDYQSATLTWNKDAVHLVGVCAPVAVSQRARIAQLSTATAVSPLVNVTANGCIFRNISIFQGVADATSLVALQVTGSRNVFENCHIAGIGHATMVTAGAASLKINAGAENVFRNCTIGLDTIARSQNTNGEIWIDGEAARNLFEDCLIEAFISNVGYEHVTINDATAVDRWLIFKRCLFTSMSADAATPQDQIFQIPTMTRGMIVLQNCDFAGDDNGCAWQTSGTTRLRVSDTVASGAPGELLII